MVDATDVAPDVAAGEPVVLFGRQEGDAIGAEEVAGWVETIPYEVLTSVGKRVPRRYVEEFDG
jgi:alanine racemase